MNHAIYYIPKAICLLSYWPFYQQFEVFLTELYRISVGFTDVPIERYLNSLWEIPVPKLPLEFRSINSASIAAVNLSSFSLTMPPRIIPLIMPIAHKVIEFSSPLSTWFPHDGFTPSLLFKFLSAENIMTILACLLCEQKVIICSKYYSFLSPIIETLHSLLFPFQWQHAFVPILPLNMNISDILEAPFPVFIGYPNDFIPSNIIATCQEDLLLVSLSSDKCKWLKGNNSQNSLDKPPAFPSKLKNSTLKILKKLTIQHGWNKFKSEIEIENYLNCFYKPVDEINKTKNQNPKKNFKNMMKNIF